jgi:hypothetical protein
MDKVMTPAAVLALLLVGLLVCWCLLRPKRSITTACPSDVAHLCPSDDHITLMYESFRVFDAFTKLHNIVYFLSGGSLLGAVRNIPGGPILWDDDHDVYMTEKNFDKFMQLLADDKDARFEYNTMSWGVQLRLRDPKRCKSVKEYYLDVFLISPDGDNMWKETWGGRRFKAKTESPYDFDCGLKPFWDIPALACKVFLDEYPGALEEIKIWNHNGSVQRSYLLKDHPELTRPMTNAHVENRLAGRRGGPSSCFSDE